MNSSLPPFCFQPAPELGVGSSSYDDNAAKAFDAYLSDPFPSISYEPTTTTFHSLLYTNAFGQQDQLLDSPLGLYDLSYDFGVTPSTLASSCFGESIDGSPMLVGMGTPELGEERSLFADEEGARGVSPTVLSIEPFPFDYALPPLPIPTPILFAPTLTPTPARATKVTARKSTKRKVKQEVDDDDDDDEFVQPDVKKVVKDRFTGTRNTKIAPIGISAPTMSRTYIIPAVTSRKVAPPAITSKLTGGASRRRSTSTSDSLSPGPSDASELPAELLSAIEEKRRMNTVAARRSRARKAGFIKELEDELEKVKLEMEAWKARAESAEQVIKDLQG